MDTKAERVYTSFVKNTKSTEWNGKCIYYANESKQTYYCIKYL